MVGNCKLPLAAFLCVFMGLAKSMWSFFFFWQFIEPDVEEHTGSFRTRDNFVSQGTFGNTWRHFCHSWSRGR